MTDLSSAASPRMAAMSVRLARVLAIVVALIAAATLVGWAAHVPVLVDWHTGHAGMNPVTAVAFLLLTAGLWILCDCPEGPGWRSRQAAQGLALLVVILGAHRLIAYALGGPWSVDEWISASTRSNNRIAPNTAAGLLLAGLALMMLDSERGRRHNRPAVWLALAPGCVGLLALTGYTYTVEPLYGFRGYIEMAVSTAVSFVLVTVATLCARPRREPLATLVSQTAGGATARRLLPVAILAPLFLGWLRLTGQQANRYDSEFGAALFAVAISAVFIVMVYLSGRSLARAELGRRATEDRLAASEAFYHTLVETLPQNIFRKDLQGRFTFANSRFLGEMRKTADQVVGKTDFDFFPKALADRYRRDDQAVVRTGTPFETVEEHVTPTGDKLYVQVIKTAVYDDRGQVIGTQGIFWDVTEKKRQEEILEEKNRQLEEAARAEREAREALEHAQGQLVQSEKLAGLGQMVAGVAHEINNPLSFVGNNVAVMQRDVGAIRKLLELYKQADGNVPADVREQIKEFEDQIDLPYTMQNLEGLFSRSRDGLRRIQQIVKDLRDFARLDESELEEVDVNAGIESTLNIIQGHAKRRNVQLASELAPLPRVTCYPAKVNQVVMNLVGNAIDASRDGGTVSVRTRADDTHVTIEVADTGSGIPPAIRKKIFDPFFTTKPQGEGTGLGLSISYGIVRDHGGEIEVDSEEGRGSTFRVKLPLRALKLAT
ncbi:MAG TPA: ATP-binding protein [Tepidisphaeraceae bacterium]|jgi:PAS domain S-box-containing protein